MRFAHFAILIRYRLFLWVKVLTSVSVGPEKFEYFVYQNLPSSSLHNAHRKRNTNFIGSGCPVTSWARRQGNCKWIGNLRQSPAEAYPHFNTSKKWLKISENAIWSVIVWQIQLCNNRVLNWSIGFNQQSKKRKKRDEKSSISSNSSGVSRVSSVASRFWNSTAFIVWKPNPRRGVYQAILNIGRWCQEVGAMLLASLCFNHFRSHKLARHILGGLQC